MDTFLNQINLGEIYYCTIRRKGLESARDFLSTFSQFPITIISADALMLPAAEIKAQYTISYADCFAIATAIREEANIVTGDPEFKKVEHLVKIDWI